MSLRAAPLDPLPVPHEPGRWACQYPEYPPTFGVGWEDGCSGCRVAMMVAALERPDLPAYRIEDDGERIDMPLLELTRRALGDSPERVIFERELTRA